jgi:sorting nexin-1/2
MDSFDDLLAPSRRALEDNPFEDPFAQPRSSSPDPWASYSRHPEHNPFQDEQVSAIHSEPEPTSEAATSFDPLESAAVNDTEPDSSIYGSSPQTPTLKSPGFRESAPSPEIRKHPIPEPDPELEPTSPSLASPITEHKSVPQSTPSVSNNGTSFSPTPTFRSSSSFGKHDGVIVTPLDQQSSGSGFENSFASLALGGETLGGWQSAVQSTFVNSTDASSSKEPSLDDDDEDNRPVLQSARTASVCFRVPF